MCTYSVCIIHVQLQKIEALGAEVEVLTAQNKKLQKPVCYYVHVFYILNVLSLY